MVGSLFDLKRIQQPGSAMLENLIPEEEQDRLITLRALKILDTAPEERFDRLTRLAKRMFGVPISLVSLVDEDRLWFKSTEGLTVNTVPRVDSFCGQAILGNELFMVENALDDERFRDSALVTGEPHVRFYAGCPIKMTNGHKMGTLCLIDNKPRSLTHEDKLLLKDLAVMVEQEIAALHLATYDDLTMISNRRGFQALSKHALKMCTRNASPASVVIFDLDDFKYINDQFGHAEGDIALRAFAQVMRQEFRDSDVFARVGGDEFVALLTGTGRNQIESALARFQNAITQYNNEAQRGYEIYYTAGYVIKNSVEDISIEELMKEADALMYEKKQQKKVI